MTSVQPIPMKGDTSAKKGPPRIIEKVIEKMEEALTSTSSKKVSSKKADEQPQPVQKHQQTPEQAQMQGNLGGSTEYELPKGTTIRLPDGHEFETQTESKLVKMRGGE